MHVLFQDKCIERVDNVMRSKDGDDKKFKEAGIPWNGKIVQDVKHASLSLMEKYMAYSMDEVKRIEDRETNRDRAREKCLNLLTGEVECPMI